MQHARYLIIQLADGRWEEILLPLVQDAALLSIWPIIPSVCNKISLPPEEVVEDLCETLQGAEPETCFEFAGIS